MSLESYKLSRKYNSSNPRKEMLREKRLQVESLYHLAADREDDTLLNGKPFKKSPRIFNLKQVDTFHYQVTVETICEEDAFYPGDYMEYNGEMWICFNSHSFHGLYRKGAFRKCNWVIYYQADDGKVKGIPCVDLNATQYNSGEYTSYQKYTLGSTQHMLYVQCNEDTVKFDDPRRFWLDRNLARPTMYKVTQNDNTTYDYKGSYGLCAITVAQNEWNPEKDKLYTFEDGTQAWVCDYWDPTLGESDPGVVSPDDLIAKIAGPTLLKNGFERKYSVEFCNKQGEILSDIPYAWSIDSDFAVSQTVNEDSTITLMVNDESCIGSSFLLQVKYQDTVICSLPIQVIEPF